MSKLDIKLTYDTRFNFSMQQNRIPTIKEIVVTNTSQEMCQDICLTLSSAPKFFDDYMLKLDRLDAQETQVFSAQDLHPYYNYISSIREIISADIKLSITISGEQDSEHTYPIELLPLEHWLGVNLFPELTASFCLPSESYIMHILRKASETDTKMIGYQSENPNDVLDQLSAIYAAITSEDIKYIMPPISFESHGQKIRFPSEISRFKMGCCLDLALFFAACIEQAGLHPLIVMQKGHAYVGAWLIDEHCYEVVCDDISFLTKKIPKNMGQICLIECTQATNKVAFSDAVKFAEKNLNNERDFYHFIDIKRARLSGIKPLPISVTDNGQYVVDTASDIDTSVLQVDRLDVLNVDMDSSHKKSRVSEWKKNLLDLSKRNPLISFNLNKQGIPLIFRKLPQLYDQLSEGITATIMPKAKEIGGERFTALSKNTDALNTLIEKEFGKQRLISGLPENELNATLVKLFRKYKHSLEESGANILYLALGFIKWIDSSDNKGARYAPIILMPLEMTRKSAKSAYQIKASDEEPQLNLSMLELLKVNFGVDTAPLENGFANGATLQEIFVLARNLIMEIKGWDLLEYSSIGLFNFSKFVMWHDLSQRMQELESHPLIKSLIDGKPQSSVFEGNNEDCKLYLPLSADSSQVSAIKDALQGKTLVLHGPPGTGKSQTITNLISSAIANNKKVLFIAEKMAALEVVKRRLENLGLGDFVLEMYSHKSNKKDVLAQLEKCFDIFGKAEFANYENRSQELVRTGKEIDYFVEKIHHKTQAGISVYDAICQGIGLEDVLEIQEIQISPQEYPSYPDGLQALYSLCSHCQLGLEPKDSAFFGAQCSDYSAHLREGVLQACKQISTHEEQVLSICTRFQELLELKEDFTHQTLSLVNELLNSLKNMPQNVDRLFTYSQFFAAESYAKKAVSDGLKQDKLMHELLSYLKPSAFTINAKKLYEEYLQANTKGALMRAIKLGGIKRKLKPHLNKPENIKAFALLIELLYKYAQLQKEIASQKSLIDACFGSIASYEEMQTVLDYCSKVRPLTKELKELGINIDGKLLKLKSADFSDNCAQISAFLQAADTLDELLCMPKSTESNFPVITCRRAESYAYSISELKEYCFLLSERKKISHNPIVKNVVDKLFLGEISASEAVDIYRKCFINAFLKQEILHDEVLSTFIRANMENKIKQYSALDDYVGQIAKREIYHICAARVPDIKKATVTSSQPYILSKVIKTNGRAITIRKLLVMIKDLLFTIKPCFLMSPISVAQYLSPELQEFDLVIYDEASQLLTSDAVGSLSRAKSAIVVGDPKQLPPTAFFRFEGSTEEEEDDFEYKDMESFLDDILALGLPQQHLLWHYRSNHESLISFSNSHFYQNRLITFPSFDEQQKRIDAVNVNGVYDKGKTKTNKIEAEAVVDGLMSFLKQNLAQNTNDSIGIITFNMHQRDLILDLIDNKLKTNPKLEPFFAPDRVEPVFVKNLENVQGDERDIILFSTTFGKDNFQKMSLNFGPINKEGGERRLNVAVSRARKQMRVYTSMQPEDIDLSRTKSEGAAKLRAFLSYAYGNQAYGATVAEQSSTRNIAEDIAASIRRLGFEVKTNVGKSKNKVDIAVCDSANPSKYILGILLDSEIYASYKTTRDREVLKESVLKKLGWQTFRVWALDWREDKERELRRISQKLKEIQSNISLQEPQADASIDYAEQDKQLKLKADILNLTVPVCVPYTQAKVKVYGKDMFSSRSRQEILNALEQILHHEAPIALPLLRKRILELYNQRSTPSANSHLDTLLRSMGVIKTKTRNTEFCFVYAPETLKQYRVNGEEFKRSFDDICKEEYAVCIKEVLKNAMRASRDDLIKAVGKEFNLSRITDKASQHIDYMISQMLKEAQLKEEVGNIISLP